MNKIKAVLLALILLPAFANAAPKQSSALARTTAFLKRLAIGQPQVRGSAVAAVRASNSDKKTASAFTMEGIKGSIDDFTDSPLETINYVSCHDNHTLWDRLQLSTTDEATLYEQIAMSKAAAQPKDEPAELTEEKEEI